MAYKFQLGDFRASGSLVQEGTISVDAASANLSGSGDLLIGGTVQLDGVADATLSVSADSLYFLDSDGLMKRDTVADIVGNIAGDGLAASSGVLAVGVDDSTIEINSDALRLKDNGVTLAKMAGLARGKFIYGDASGDPAALAVGSAHQFLQADGTDLAWVSMSGDIALAAGVATIQANAVEGSMLNNNIVSGLTDIGGALATTDELIVSDNGTIRRTDLSRLSTMMQSTGLSDSSGQLSVAAAQTSITSIINASIGKIGTAADQEYIDFGTANEISLVINDSVALNANATGVIVEGNLTVLGTTTTVDSTTINVSQSFTFEGPADAHETTLHCGTPIADTTLNLPAMSAGTYYLPVLAAASTTSITATPAELNIMDGGASDSSVTIVDADQIIINDNGTMKQTAVTDLVAYLDAMNVQNIDDSGTIQLGMNYFSALGGAESCTLPASPSVGNIVYVKAPSNCSSTNTITINKAGSQTIDGGTSIVLESPYAAVSLCYVANNTWSIF